jgi:hypothetical protein
MNADLIVIGTPLPEIAVARYVRDHVVAITWAAGSRAGLTEEVDLAPIIMQYKAFAPLRANPALFAAVEIVEGGDGLGWDEGRIDLAATTLERLAAEAMTNGDFRDFLNRHGLTYDAASAVLGISRRQVAYYAADRPVPRLVALACAGLDARQAA